MIDLTSIADYLAYMTRVRRMFGADQRAPRPGYGYVCMEDYVLDRGRTFESAPLLPAERDHVDRICERAFPGRRDPRLKECFYNAQLLAQNDRTRRLRYHEGFATTGILPCLHGWVTIGGKVVDLTWRKTNHDLRGRDDGVYGEFPEGWDYVGVSFTTEAVLDSMLTTGAAMSLIDRWVDGWPELQKDRLRPLPALPDHVPVMDAS